MLRQREGLREELSEDCVGCLMLAGLHRSFGLLEKNQRDSQWPQAVEVGSRGIATGFGTADSDWNRGIPGLDGPARIGLAAVVIGLARDGGVERDAELEV